MKIENTTEHIENKFHTDRIKYLNIETHHLGYKSGVKLILDSLKLNPRLRLLDLYFGENPLIPFLFKNNPIAYFGFETSNDFVKNNNARHQYYLKQRKAVFDNFDGLHIPYVMNFFHRVLSVNPRIEDHFTDIFLKEIYRVMVPGGIMVLIYKVSNYKRCLKLISFMKQSPFMIDDLKVLNLDLNNRSHEEGYRSVFFVLKKPVLKEAN